MAVVDYHLGLCSCVRHGRVLVTPTVVRAEGFVGVSFLDL